jgi:hypothetical protein
LKLLISFTPNRSDLSVAGKRRHDDFGRQTRLPSVRRARRIWKRVDSWKNQCRTRVSQKQRQIRRTTKSDDDQTNSNGEDDACRPEDDYSTINLLLTENLLTATTSVLLFSHW